VGEKGTVQGRGERGLRRIVAGGKRFQVTGNAWGRGSYLKKPDLPGEGVDEKSSD